MRKVSPHKTTCLGVLFATSTAVAAVMLLALRTQSETPLPAITTCTPSGVASSSSPDRAALHGIAAILKSVRDQREPDTAPAVIAAIESIAAHPEQALSTGRDVLGTSSSHASAYGPILIAALINVGEYPVALQLTGCGSEAERTEWMTSILSSWLSAMPAEGPAIVGVMKDCSVSPAVFEQVIAGWASVAPAQLLSYALTLPRDEYRRMALSAALDHQALRDPLAVLQMAPQLSNPDEFDYALSRLITRGDTLVRPTGAALEWAESLQNLVLRRTSLRHVIMEWRAQDPAAALRFLDQSAVLPLEERHQLAGLLGPSQNQPSP